MEVLGTSVARVMVILHFVGQKEWDTMLCLN